jgi:hypothetical protein
MNGDDLKKRLDRMHKKRNKYMLAIGIPALFLVIFGIVMQLVGGN